MDMLEQALAAFNGGLVRVDDATNPRGYVIYYKPREAMQRAIQAAIAAETERCAMVAEGTLYTRAGNFIAAAIRSKP